MTSDMEGITSSLLLLCLIGLTNANTSPTIDRTLYRVCENIPVGGEAFTIEASDRENDPLTYELFGANAMFFEVNADTGVVSVKGKLDRENNDLIELGVRVSDGSNITPGDLSIILLDANDNRPVFVTSSYDRDVSENTPVNEVLFRVQASDVDTGSAGVVRYSIASVIPPEGSTRFSIAPISGEVKLAGSLNYTSLSTFYRLNITATDDGGSCESPFVQLSSFVFSFITVVDVPDLNPQFTSPAYTASIMENSAPDTPVFTVIALDMDTGVNDAMRYSIEDSTVDSLFKISADTGSISVNTPIDRETVGDTITLTVKATESKLNIHGLPATATATVRITISDDNDEVPEFYNCALPDASCRLQNQFTGEVLENSLGSISFDMTVKDKDKNSRFALTLDGPDKDVFSVEPKSAMSESIVQLLVKQPQKLDFEKTQQMILRVIAVDEENDKFSSTATVTINIKDANDNSPVFPLDTYKLNVNEHAEVGTTLDTITAMDPDLMDQGNLTYKLLPDSILPYFDVDPKSGRIYVKNSTLLDREVRSLYSATLQARDTDGKPGSTVVEITLTDINDKHPVISRESYLDFVVEGGELRLQIQATDADEPDTPNSEVVFQIVPSKYSSNFTIDPNTGVLTNNGKLDREALDPKLGGRIELNVTATDKGTPPLSTMVNVIINVEDVNDNMPVFGESSYKFRVKEGQKGEFVGSVRAEDLDQTTDFNRISFNIIEGSFGNFIIRNSPAESGYVGNISVDPDVQLDHEGQRKSFTLVVEAEDLQQKKAQVTVEVEVVDVNDERPEFNPTNPVQVRENTSISEAVGTFTARDRDGNHSLVYQLESVRCKCNTSWYACDWFILEPSGEVKVNPESAVDYEDCNEAIVEAQVVDEYTEMGDSDSASTGEMVIAITDINDNAPEFLSSDAVFVAVLEITNTGTSVALVTATDRDSVDHGKIGFKVTGVQFEDANNQTSSSKIVFEAVTTQQDDKYVGIIQTTESLGTSKKGKYLVTVTATDNGGLATNTILNIFTVDESYKVELRFVKTKDEVEGNEASIVRALTAATTATVKVVAIKSDSSEQTRASGAVMETYFVYGNGSALTSTEVQEKLNDPVHLPTLGQLGLLYIDGSTVTPTETDPLQFALLGVVGGLIVVLGVLITSLVCTRRNYGRKLKAEKARNFAATVDSNNQKSGPMVPGTNKYTMEGANPVLNLNIDTTMALDMEEDSSEVDKISLNSLDYNDDMAMSEKDTKHVMMIEEEDDEDGAPPEYIEPLGAALAQRGQKRTSNQGQVGFTNPAFSTTDL